MDLSNMFETESSYLKAAEYPDMNKTLRIEGTGTDELTDREANMQKIVWIKLSGASKPMRLNMTNGKTLVSHFGPDSDDWIDKKVLLTTKGYTVDGNHTRGWIMMPIVEGKSELDDEIPF